LPRAFDAPAPVAPSPAAPAPGGGIGAGGAGLVDAGSRCAVLGIVEVIELLAGMRAACAREREGEKGGDGGRATAAAGGGGAALATLC
jgi:hypothetical protein